MILRFPSVNENPSSIMRRIGYTFQRQAGHEQSFVRPLAQQGFPRFHAYIHTEGSTLVISIHLDQKKETYGRDTRHHGEYEDDGALAEEVERIKTSIAPPANTEHGATFEP